jgi:phosphate transport system substrate-binding protein
MKIHSLLWSLLLLMAAAPARPAEPLTASGCSISMVGYLNDLVRDYEKETGQKILIRGGGSYVGLTELGANRVDFAASCKSRGKEDPASLKFIPVAWDALVFIAHPDNPVSNLSLQDIRDIYEGKITNWKVLGGADLPLKSYISTPMGMAGVGETLTKYFLNDKWPQPTGNSSMQSASVALWEQMVEKNPEGFASTGFDSAHKRKVKLLAVNDVVPTRANIISGRYPYKRPLYLVAPEGAKPEVLKFFEFALSKKGQQLISSYGAVPLAALK